MKYFRRGQPAQHFPGPVVDLFHILITFFLGDIMKAGALGQVASDATVEVFVRSPLEGRIRVSKKGGNPEEVSKFVVKRELLPLSAVTEATAWAGRRENIRYCANQVASAVIAGIFTAHRNLD